MPNYAWLETDLECPHCHSKVEGKLVKFQWGYCPTRYPSDHYQLGEDVRWRVCPDGRALAWTYFYDNACNIGDPAVRDLVVLDSSDAGDFPTLCPTCRQPLVGAAVEIRNGIINKAWIYLSGEFGNHLTEVVQSPHGDYPRVTRPEVEMHIIQADGSLKPMPEWNDRGMDSVKDC